MKKFITALAVVLSLAFSAGESLAVFEPPTPTAEFPMGNTNIVFQYCASKVDRLIVKLLSSSGTTLIRKETWEIFTSKAHIDFTVQSYAQELVDQYTSTNGNGGQLVIDVIARNSAAVMLIANYPFSLSSGVVAPSFQGLSLKCPKLVPYVFPDITQAILQSDNMYGAKIVCDSRQPSPLSIMIVGGTVHLPFLVVTDPGRTNRLTVVRNNGVTKSFKVYLQGTRVSEILPEVAIQTVVTNGTNTINLILSKGEAGRVYKVQQLSTVASVIEPPPYYRFTSIAGYEGWKTNFSFDATGEGLVSFRLAVSDAWLP